MKFKHKEIKINKKGDLFEGIQIIIAIIVLIIILIGLFIIKKKLGW